MLSVDIGKRLPGFELTASFSAAGRTTVIFGPSGSGKTLTLRAVAGIVEPDRGRISLDGVALFDSDTKVNLSPQRRRVGYVPQSYALFPHLTVEENIAYGLRDVARRDRASLVREMMGLTEIDGLGGRRPRELSGGQQQRVALARALAPRPQVLLLDEPFSSLDRALRDGLRHQFRELHESWAISTVVVTHDLDDAFFLGERIVVYDGGRVLQQGDREEVFYRPATCRVAEFVGTRNILRGTVLGVDGDALYLGWRGHTLRVLTEPLDKPLDKGRDVHFSVRPTQIMIVRRDRLPHLGPPPNPMCGRIVEETIKAETYVLHLRLNDSPEPYDLEIELPGYVYHRLGLGADKDVQVSIRPGALHVIPEPPAS
jgi:molybdate transport system ATP-binding protein